MFLMLLADLINQTILEKREKPTTRYRKLLLTQWELGGKRDSQFSQLITVDLKHYVMPVHALQCKFAGLFR